MDQSDVPMSQDAWLEVDAPAVPNTVQDTVPAESSGKLTFSGNEDDSVTEFIQAIQKHVFEQDRTTDDRWIVGYVGTCFTDSAMVWYSNLDDRTRNNWTRLRKALMNRFGPKPQPPSTPSTITPQVFGRPGCPGVCCTPPMAPLPLREKAPNELRGQIEVFVPERNLWLGFLGIWYEANGATFTVSGSKASAALFSFVPDAENKPVQLRHENPSDFNHPYIGLALDEPSLQLQPQNSWGPLPGAPAPPFYGFGGPQYSPMLSPYAVQMAQSPYLQQQSQSNTNTSPSWTLKACTESSQDERRRRASKTTNLWEKASAAVWKYDANTKELCVSWPNDDGSEEQLAVSVPKPTSYGGNIRPTLHRAQDNAAEALNPGQAPLPQTNIPVKFFFVPED